MVDAINNTENIDFSFVIKEFENVQILQQKQIDQLKQKIDDTTQEENKQKNDQQQQDKNKLKKDKLKSNLTSDQKKRYTQIGKTFLKGASGQFDRVRKAVQFKQQMSTGKNKFLQSYDKIKEGISKKLKGKGFWVKLIIAVGLIALAVGLFKDKIVHFFEKLKNEEGGIIGGLTKYISNIPKAAATFMKGLFSNIVNTTLSDILQNKIPTLLDNFFTITLPNAIFNTFMTLLSTFSSTAAEHLQVSDEVSNQMDNVVNSASDNNDNKSKEQNLNEQETETLNNVNDSLLALQNSIGTINNKFIALQNEMYELHNASTSIIFGAMSLQGKISSQAFASIINNVNENKNTYLEKFKEKNKDNDDFRKDITAMISGVLSTTQASKEQKELLWKAIYNGIGNTSNISGDSYNSMLNAIISGVNGGQEYLSNQAASAAEKDDKNQKIAQATLQKTIENAGKHLSATITNDMLSKINEFLGGDMLKQMIVSGLSNFSNYYNNFFQNSVSAITNVAKSFNDKIKAILTPTLKNADGEGKQGNNVASSSENYDGGAGLPFVIVTIPIDTSLKVSLDNQIETLKNTVTQLTESNRNLLHIKDNIAKIMRNKSDNTKSPEAEGTEVKNAENNNQNNKESIAALYAKIEEMDATIVNNTERIKATQNTLKKSITVIPSFEPLVHSWDTIV